MITRPEGLLLSLYLDREVENPVRGKIGTSRRSDLKQIFYKHCQMSPQCPGQIQRRTVRNPCIFTTRVSLYNLSD